MTNTEMLQNAIRESGMKKGAIVKLMNFKSYDTLRAKVENRSEFTASEIETLCRILQLNREQREAIFFANDAESYSA